MNENLLEDTYLPVQELMGQIISADYAQVQVMPT